MLSQFQAYYVKEDWANLKDQVLGSVKFWTRLPIPLGAEYVSSADDLARSTPFIAMIYGVMLSLLVVMLSILHVPYGVGAALVLVAALVLTGGLHEDGLANCADSIGGKTVECRLEILNDSRLGTFGVLALALSLLVRWQAVSQLLFEGTFVAVGGIIAAAVLSRIGAMVPFALIKPADDAGAPQMSTPYFYIMIIAGFLFAGLFLAPVISLSAFILISAAIAGALWVLTTWAQHSFGGTVKDLRGAVQQLLEVIVLVGVVMFGF